MGSILLRTFICVVCISLCWSKTVAEVVHEGVLAEDLVTGEKGPPYKTGEHAPTGNNTHGNGTHGGHEIERFPIASIDFSRVQTPLIIGLWLFCACLGKIAFHMTPKIGSMFPESCMLIIMGLVIGGIFFYANPNAEGHVSPLTANTFFLYLLPPIILDAGYFMPNRLFFDHLGTILVFAVVGTIWNALTIGISLYALTLTGLFGAAESFPMLHIFLFSSLISAVDPVAVLAVFEEIHVEEVLFILVFGESLLNDGVTVVLYHMFEGFSLIGENNLIPVDIVSGLISFLLVALGGTVIGIIWGFLAAFVTRFTHQVRVIEPVFIFVMSYLAYLNAELFHWSGILAITFCGITMKNYTEQNMSQKSQTTTKYAMKMLASSSETVIFLFLGVATVHGTKHDLNIWFTVFTIIFCSVYRVLGVLILSAICNRFRVQKIDFVQKFMMSYGGLRGAVAFALAITINAEHIPLAPMFVTTTITMVFFTVFVQGITIKPLVQLLGVKKSEKRKLNMNERLHGRSIDYIMAGVEDITGKFGNHYIRGWFKRLHNNYLQPCFVRHMKAKEPKLFETLSQLKMQDALNYMHQKPASLTDLESFSKVLQNNMYSRNSIREWNLDVTGLEYKMGDKDINEARFHHILSDDYHPVKARRQSTYKRHAVRDDELETQTDFHDKMYQRARQVAMTSIRNRKFKRPAETNIPTVNRPITQQQNGTDVRLKTDYLEETARDNEGYVNTEGNLITSKTEGLFNRAKPADKRQSKKGPSIAETILPWKRFTDDDETPSSVFKMKRSMSIAHQDGTVEFEDIPQTMAEIELPWKRTEDDDMGSGPNKQHEFPPWATNKNYIDYYSPTNTLLDSSRPGIMPEDSVTYFDWLRNSESPEVIPEKLELDVPLSQSLDIPEMIPEEPEPDVPLPESLKKPEIIQIEPEADVPTTENSKLPEAIFENPGPAKPPRDRKVIGYPEKRPTIKEIFAKRHSMVNLFGRRSSHVEEMPTLRNSAKDDIYSRRSSLKDDPTAHRRESLKDFKELNALRATLAAAELSRLHEPQPDRRSSRDSLSFDSLLNTVIVEEEKTPQPSANTQPPQFPPRDVVITMNPGGGVTTDNTRF